MLVRLYNRDPPQFEGYRHTRVLCCPAADDRGVRLTAFYSCTCAGLQSYERVLLTACVCVYLCEVHVECVRGHALHVSWSVHATWRMCTWKLHRQRHCMMQGP